MNVYEQALIDPPPVDGGAAIKELEHNSLSAVFQHELGQVGEQGIAASGLAYSRRLAACCEANMRSMTDHTVSRLRATPSWLWFAERPVEDLPYGSIGPAVMDLWRTRLAPQAQLQTLDATHYEVIGTPHVEVIAGTIGATIGDLVR